MNDAAPILSIPFDLFVSYADADRWWVEGFLLDALTHADIRVQSESTFRLGTPRLQEFANAVTNSRRTLVVLSPSYMANGSTLFVTLLAQQYGMDTQTWPVIPLTLQTLEQPDPTLAMLVGLDARAPADWPRVVSRLCKELACPMPGPSQVPACPYPGMRAFRTEDGAAFFGREREVRVLVEQHLLLHPFIAIIGASGSGKSSLALAGLVPALNRSGLFGSGGWDVRSMRPGPQPRAALMAAIGPTATAARRLLVVDQFEELFTTGTQPIDRATFCDELLDLSQSGAWWLVITVRADFYGDLMRLGQFWLEVQQHRLELTPLGRDALREAIVRPAQQVAVQVEPALVERLLGDAGDEPGILPFLQEALLLLWEKIQRRCLPLTAYESMTLDSSDTRRGPQRWRSGLEAAMGALANQALSNLPNENARSLARRVLLRLVQFGEGRADTRRQQLLSQLQSDGDDPSELAMVVRHLSNARLLTMSANEDSDTDNVVVDISHEALLNGWPKLADWIGQCRKAEVTRRWLLERAERWRERRSKGQNGGLLDSAETNDAKQWLEEYSALLGRDTAILELVSASEAETKRARQENSRRNWRLALIAVLASLSAIALAYRLWPVPRLQIGGSGTVKTALIEPLTAELERCSGSRLGVQDTGSQAALGAVAQGWVGTMSDQPDPERVSGDNGLASHLVVNVLVAFDDVVFIVSRENPIESIPLDPLRKLLFGSSDEAAVAKWSMLGMKDAERASKGIKLWVPRPESGTGQFLESVLGKGMRFVDLKRTELGPDKHVGLVAEDPLALGVVSGAIANKNQGVRQVRITGAGDVPNLRRGLYFMTSITGDGSIQPEHCQLLKCLLGREIQDKLSTIGLGRPSEQVVTEQVEEFGIRDGSCKIREPKPTSTMGGTLQETAGVAELRR